jgi:hypothetical protein
MVPGKVNDFIVKAHEESKAILKPPGDVQKTKKKA